MRAMLKRFAADECGSAATEYGLIAAGLSIAIATMLQGIGMRLAVNLAETRHFTR
jgi:pilus assembly protein Flp/PilA